MLKSLDNVARGEEGWQQLGTSQSEHEILPDDVMGGGLLETCLGHYGSKCDGLVCVDHVSDHLNVGWSACRLLPVGPLNIH